MAGVDTSCRLQSGHYSSLTAPNLQHTANQDRNDQCGNHSSMTAALEGGEWSAAHPGRTLPPGKTRYPFYRRLGGPQGRSGRAENLVPTGIRSRTVQPVAQSLYRLSYPAQCSLKIHADNSVFTILERPWTRSSPGTWRKMQQCIRCNLDSESEYHNRVLETEYLGINTTHFITLKVPTCVQVWRNSRFLRTSNQKNSTGIEWSKPGICLCWRRQCSGWDDDKHNV